MRQPVASQPQKSFGVLHHEADKVRRGRPVQLDDPEAVHVDPHHQGDDEVGEAEDSPRVHESSVSIDQLQGICSTS